MAGGNTILELKHHVLNGRLAQAGQGFGAVLEEACRLIVCSGLRTTSTLCHPLTFCIGLLVRMTRAES